MTGSEIEKVDPWEKIPGETDGQYFAFTEFLKLGARRSIKATASQVGMSYETMKSYARKNQWVARANEYDIECNKMTPQELSSPTETLAYQFAVGSAMLDLGIKAVQLKRPGDIKVSDAIKLIEKGTDLQRKALGMDSPQFQININSNSVDALNDLLAEIELDAIEESEDDEE